MNTSEEYHQDIVSVPEFGTVLTMTSLTNARRVANNQQAKRIIKAETDGATIKELMPLISGMSNFTALMEGRFDDAQLSLGQGIGRINTIQTVEELFKGFVADYSCVYKRMA